LPVHSRTRPDAAGGQVELTYPHPFDLRALAGPRPRTLADLLSRHASRQMFAPSKAPKPLHQVFAQMRSAKPPLLFAV
jgi:hypothetical protein